MDKVRLIRLLADELAIDEAIPADQSHPVWSPHGAFDAADVFLRAASQNATAHATEPDQ